MGSANGPTSAWQRVALPTEHKIAICIAGA